MQGSVSAHIEDHEDPSSAEWEDSLAAVLARLGVRRLKDAARVLSDAPQDRDPEAGEDQYYVVRAEGMEYDSEVKGDELEPGGMRSNRFVRRSPPVTASARARSLRGSS